MESGPRTGWERVAALIGHARYEHAPHDLKREAQEALLCLGPVERRAFLGRVIKRLPDLEQQMGKTTAEVDALVTKAKAKLDAQDEEPAA